MKLSQALVLLSWVSLSLSWTVSTGVDLAWPPLLKSGYITINSQIVGSDSAWFPCNQPLTGNEPRVIFPITGGQLQWNLTNSTGQHPNYYFVINLYIAQISADTSRFGNATAYFGTDVWKNFATGMDCGNEMMNATTLVNKALDTNFKNSEVVGMNATFGMRSVLFTSDYTYDYPADVYNIEEMFQCGYVTFVADDTPKASFGGACISASKSSTIRSTSSSSTVRTTVSPSTARTTAVARTTSSSSRGSMTTSVATFRTSSLSNTTSFTSSWFSGTATPTTFAGTSSSRRGNVGIIGVGVGASIGISSILFIIGFLLFRRRRKHGGTLALDFWVHGRENEDGDVTGKKEKGVDKTQVGKGGDSDGILVSEEQPPSYGEITGGQNQDVILKSSPIARS